MTISSNAACSELLHRACKGDRNTLAPRPLLEVTANDVFSVEKVFCKRVAERAGNIEISHFLSSAGRVPHHRILHKNVQRHVKVEGRCNPLDCAQGPSYSVQCASQGPTGVARSPP